MTIRYSVIPRTLCFIFYEDEVLLLKAGNSKAWAGRYDPVGGHIEKGEDVVESAEREIFEETGLTVTDTRLRAVIHSTNFFGKNIMLFVTTSTAGTKDVTANHEGELVWVKLSEIENYPVFADVGPILEKIRTDEKLFTGTVEFDDAGSVTSLNLR